MDKALPYGRIFFNDLLGECLAQGLGLRERGILFHLLWVQHQRGWIPADPHELRRLVGDDARADEIKQVLNLFFPIREDGKRRNAQHAEARDAALHAYESAVRKGQIGAEHRWFQYGSATSSGNGSANAPADSNQNQNQNQNENQNSTEASRGEKKTEALKKSAAALRARADHDEDDDETPF